MTDTGRRRSSHVLVGCMPILGLPVLALVAVLGYREFRLERLRVFCASIKQDDSREWVALNARSAGLDYAQNASLDFVVFRSVWPGLAWCIIDHDGKRVVRAKLAY